MLALEPLIAARLKALPALSAWSARTGAGDEDRSPVPAVDVRMGGAAVSQVRQRAATLQPEWQVTLVVHRAATAAAVLDAAIEAVIAALHNWRPGEGLTRQWTELQISRVLPVNFAEVGLVGFELTFTTASVFNGQS